MIYHIPFRGSVEQERPASETLLEHNYVVIGLISNSKNNNARMSRRRERIAGIYFSKIPRLELLQNLLTSDNCSDSINVRHFL